MNSAPILLVEDNPEDFEATKRAFEKLNLSNPLVHVEDGDDAIDYLFQRGRFGDAPRPALVLLDLNLPGTDGHEVLEEVKADPRTSMIPIVILTTSKDERDITASYMLGANSYLQKPVSLDGLLELVKRLRDYWLELVVLPKTP